VLPSQVMCLAVGTWLGSSRAFQNGYTLVVSLIGVVLMHNGHGNAVIAGGCLLAITVAPLAYATVQCALVVW